jgi:hypothetical protein
MPLPMGEGLSEFLNTGYACRGLQPKTFGRGFDSRRLHSMNAPDLLRSGASLFSGFSGSRLTSKHLGDVAGEGDQHLIRAPRPEERQADREPVDFRQR